MMAQKTYSQHLLVKLGEAERVADALRLEVAQLRTFEARAALAATELTLAHLDNRQFQKLIEGKVNEFRRMEFWKNDFWLRCDDIRNMADNAITVAQDGMVAMVSAVDILTILDRPKEKYTG